MSNLDKAIQQALSAEDAALVAAVAVAMLKIWSWMEMHKNQVLREVKRLELQVARLAARGASTST